MNIKKEHVILAIVIIALSLYLLLHNPNQSHFEPPPVPAVEADDITRIEIADKGQTIVVQQKGDEWRLMPQSYLADSQKVKAMLDTIENFKLTAYISQAEKYARYELDQDHRIQVKAYAGETLKRTFSIGKTADSFRHTFVKLPKDPAVYHADGNLRRTYEMTVDALRDKTVLSFDPQGVEELVMVHNGSQTRFIKGGSNVDPSTAGQTDESPSIEPAGAPVWQTENGEPAVKDKIEGLIDDLSSLKCESYFMDGDGTALKDPIFAFRIVGAQNAALTIFAAAEEDEGRYPARSSANADGFFLRKWKADELMKDPLSLLEKTE